ncbi:MAG TPA: choice-of-anchor D domain-containing protein [Kofleriaceae bacterium]
MRRTRARVLAAAVVITTAGVASASLDLVVQNPNAGQPVSSAVGDAGLDGSDAPTEGGFDAPTEGGSDAPPTATINIVENPIAITGPSGNVATATATIVTADTGQLGSASIASADSSMTLSYCGLATCTWPAQALPYSLTVQCVPGSGQTTGTLTVFEASSGSSSSASVTCTSTTSGPVLDVTPNSLAFGALPVNQTSTPQAIHIANTGGSMLDNVLIDFGSQAASWQASACTSGLGACRIGAGSGMDVDITFAPTTHGSKDVVATVSSSNGGSDSVALTGTGLGGIMSVQSPAGPGYLLDIGTIPRGQPFSRDIVLENLGNADYTATTSTPTAPYTIAPGPFTIAGGGSGPIAVTCQSATATTTDNPQTISITSDAYQGSTASVQVRCKIADTQLQITPTMFDFGEVRVGTPEPTIDITLTNPPGSVAAQITAFDLREHKPGLQLTSPAVPFSIAPSASSSAALTLHTGADTTLDGEYLELTVDGANLQFPVSGKVVTPHSRVVPQNQLDLGTACVGSDVSGNVMLINDGTATLSVDPPQMDQSFIASSPGTPSLLAPMTSLTASVSPAMSSMGPITGTLTWHDDVPNDHQIAVTLDYVASGTALSPRGLDFGQVPVDTPTGAQHIKLQNCDLAPTRIKIESLKTKQGALGAWIVEPHVGFTKELATKETQAVTVSFVPPARGRYEAELTVQTAGGRQIVHLVGDATGRDFDNTSFYACACNGPGAPARGWPIVLAIAIVIGRRRRGSSSSR